MPELLDPGCEYVVQQEWTQYRDMLETGCDAALLVGMHARAGTADGIMNHTVSGQSWQNLWFNGVPIGETGINAALCGNWNCPVVLVTGDDATVWEARELLGDNLTTVSVKKGLGRHSARSLVPARARELIEAAARDSLREPGRVQPYDPGKPCEILVEFSRTDAFDQYALKPAVEVVGDRRVAVTAEDWWTAWQRFYF